MTPLTLQDVRTILDRLKSAPSGIRMSTEKDYRFEVSELVHEDPTVDGFLVRCGFWRPDTNSGSMGEGFGRWMHVPRSASETAVVMTAWLCVTLVLQHEAMEAFEYMGVKILNPHKNVEELAYPISLGPTVEQK